MLTDRQNNIFKLIVTEYIKSARPVGSNLICDELKCSSATVRSEMANLENLGLLEKTHTSSGRIPSEKGYRYYVDNMMELKKMNAEDMLKLQIIFNNQQLQLSDCLNESLKLISDITSYTSVVLGSKSHDSNLKELNVVPIDDENLIIIVITDKGHVEHKNVHLQNVQLEEIKKTVSLINNLIVGTPIDEVSQKLEFEIKPIIGQYVRQHELVYNTFYQVFKDFSNKNVNIVGKNNILNQPEFNNIDRIKEIFNKFDDQEEFATKIEETDNNIKIYIGKENNLDDDITVIKTKYHSLGEEGTIAIVGPKRMDYDRVVSLLEYIKDNIED